jgi:hypothetical protein
MPRLIHMQIDIDKHSIKKIFMTYFVIIIDIDCTLSRNP